MNGYVSSDDDHRPVMWLRGHPVFAAHFIVLVFVVSMLVTTVLQLSKLDALLAWLTFTNQGVIKGEIWRIFTYGLVNVPSIPFVIDMFMIVWFGRELEKSFGRRGFLGLYAGIYLLPPLLFTALAPWLPAAFAGEAGALALFVAFATLYPEAMMLFNLLAKWVALVLVGIYTLMALSAHNWQQLISLWAAVGFAYAFVRHHQGRLALPKFNFSPSKPQLRALPDPKPRKISRAKPVKDTTMAEIDALLDKIAQSGISSLTANEREKLETARENLRKSKRGG